MRAEPWMNYTPPPPISPLERARSDRSYWNSRVTQLREQLADAEKHLADANERIDRHAR